MTGKKYGCYDPKGEICVGCFGNRIRDIARDLPIEKVDNYYAESFEYWRDEYDFGNDKEYKEAVRVGSSIGFCDICRFKDNFNKCKSYRKRKKRQLFY